MEHLGGGLSVSHLVGQLFLLSKDVFASLIISAQVTEGLLLQSTFSRLDMQLSSSIGDVPASHFVDHFLMILCLNVLSLLMAQIFKQSQAETVKKAITDHHAAVAAGCLLKLQFTTIFEYLQLLQMIAFALRSLGSHAMFCLAAAVSDFYVPWESMVEHKIQSASGPLDMRLAQVPKMLGVLRKDWTPLAFCVSFKLETDVHILLEKADAALKKYGVHAVVANELATRKEEVTVVASHGKTRICRGNGDDVERPLIQLLVEQHTVHIESEKQHLHQ